MLSSVRQREAAAVATDVGHMVGIAFDIDKRAAASRHSASPASRIRTPAVSGNAIFIAAVPFDRFDFFDRRRGGHTRGDPVMLHERRNLESA